MIFSSNIEVHFFTHIYLKNSVTYHPKGSFFTFLAMTNQNYYKCIFNGVINTAFTVLFTQIMIQVSQTIMEILKRLDLIFIIS